MPGQMKQKITIKGCQNTIDGQLTVQAITLVPIMQEAATKRSTDEGKIVILYSIHKINAEPLNIAEQHNECQSSQYSNDSPISNQLLVVKQLFYCFPRS